MKKSVAVLRVSTSDQRKEYGPGLQLDDIQARSKSLGDDEIVEVIEIDETATDGDNRPQFNAILHRLLAKGKAGEIQRVYFARPDRLSRDGEDMFFHYVAQLERVGKLELRFGVSDVEPENPHRMVLLFFHAFKAKEDAKTIKHNTAGGRRRRAFQDKKLPTGNVPWQCRYETKAQVGDRSAGVPTGVYPERRKWLRKAWYMLCVEGLSLRAICRHLQDANVIPPKLQMYMDMGYGFDEALLKPQTSLRWSPSTLVRLLTHKSVLGEFWTQFDGDDGPVLIHNDESLVVFSADEYRKLEAILSSHKALSKRNTKYAYGAFQGRVYCWCGRKAAGNTNRSSVTQGLFWSYFQCQLHRSTRINVQTLEHDARAMFAAIITRPEAIIPSLTRQDGLAASREQLEAQKEGVQAEIKDLGFMRDKLLRAFMVLKDYPEEKLKAESTKLDRREQALERELAEVEQALRAEYDVSITKAYVSELARQLETIITEEATPAEYQNLLDEYSVRIFLGKEKGQATMRVSLDAVIEPSVLLQGSYSTQQSNTLFLPLQMDELHKSAMVEA